MYNLKRNVLSIIRFRNGSERWLCLGGEGVFRLKLEK